MFDRPWLIQSGIQTPFFYWDEQYLFALKTLPSAPTTLSSHLPVAVTGTDSLKTLKIKIKK